MRAASSNRWRFDRPQAEHGTRRAALAPVGMSKPCSVGQVDLVQREARGSREGAGHLAGVVAVVADAEPEVEAVGLVAELEEDVPHRERVLAAGHGDERPLVGLQHVEVLDGPGHLVAAQPQEVLGAEVGVVAPDVDDRRLLAHGALHAAPPEMTGRISTVSASCEQGVAGHEGVADDHEHRLAVHVEAIEERVHPHRAVHLQLARRVAQQHPHRRYPWGCVVWVMRIDSPGRSTSVSVAGRWRRL